MGYYAVPGSVTTLSSAGYKTGAQVNAPATVTAKRGKAYELMVGSCSPPNSTDCSVQCDVSRITATGAGAYTAWTPTPLDPADPVSVTISGTTATAEATAITANSSLWNIGMNQRATVRWIAAQESQYLIWPAVLSNGLVLRAMSATLTTSFATQISFLE